MKKSYDFFSSGSGLFFGVVNVATLFYGVLIKNHRKKLIQQRVDGAIKAVRNLGIILDVEITDGVKGQKKYIFTINKIIYRTSMQKIPYLDAENIRFYRTLLQFYRTSMQFYRTSMQKITGKICMGDLMRLYESL